MGLVTPSKRAPKAIVQLRTGSVVVAGEREYLIIRLESPTIAIGRDTETRVDRAIHAKDITRVVGIEETEVHGELGSVDPEKLELAFDKFSIIQPVLTGELQGRKAIAGIAEASGYSIASVYKWINQFKKTGVVTGLIRKTRSDINQPRLDERVETILKKVLDAEYLDDVRISPTDVYNKIKTLCTEAGVPCPSRSVIRVRVAALDPVTVAKTRGSRNDLLSVLPKRGEFPGANTPYAVIQIDHTLVDVELVDEVDRIAIGRPWITVAIDVHSRMVVAWYISLDPPGTLATGICLANAMLPKHKLLSHLGVTHPWPCAGRIGIVHADNAREFRGQTLRKACGEYGFSLKFRKVQKPNYGAHIERLLGTLLTEIHALPGTTKSNPKALGDYRSADNAVMTLGELDQWLANLILGDYHHREHSSLGVPPIRAYLDGLRGSDDDPGVGMIPLALDEDRLRVDFLPMDERVVGPDGIVLNYIKYYSPVLNPWIGAKNPEKLNSKQFTIRYDPRDMSYILFYDPRTRLHHRIPYANRSNPPLSLWEINAIKRHLAATYKGEIDENILFRARQEMMRIENKAKEATKKVARDREKKRTHDRVEKAGSPFISKNKPPPAPVVRDVPSYDDVTPFDEVEDL